MVRLRSEKDLPTSHPDTDYPAGYMFPNETTVNDASIERPLQGPYIAGQCTRERVHCPSLAGYISSLSFLFSLLSLSHSLAKPLPIDHFF